MPWTIPDKGEGDHNHQSILFQEYLEGLIAGLNGVCDGCRSSQARNHEGSGQQHGFQHWELLRKLAVRYAKPHVCNHSAARHCPATPKLAISLALLARRGGASCHYMTTTKSSSAESGQTYAAYLLALSEAHSASGPALA